MKSGAGDDPFADDPSEDADDSPDREEPSSGAARASAETGGASITQEPPARSDREEETTNDSVSELPYKYRRDSVKDGRTQQPMFLQDETEALIDETVTDIESQFDEDVYKTDVVEAMIVAGGEDATPEAVLRRWGYGMKNS